MAVNYPSSIDTNVGQGTAGATLSVGGAGGQSHVAAHNDISSVAISLETNVAHAVIKQFSALDNHPPASAYATFSTRNALGVLQFPVTTDNSAIFVGIVPNTVLLTTGVKAVLKWASVTATTGAVEWAGSVDNIENAHSLDTDSYGTVVSVVTTVSGTAAYVNTTTINITSIQSLASDKGFKLKITRRASDVANDTMTDTASLFAVELYAY